ncbi:E3 ubiquitin ligase, partial [Rhizophlyctis rosea]
MTSRKRVRLTNSDEEDSGAATTAETVGSVLFSDDERVSKSAAGEESLGVGNPPERRAEPTDEISAVDLVAEKLFENMTDGLIDLQEIPDDACTVETVVGKAIDLAGDLQGLLETYQQQQQRIAEAEAKVKSIHNSLTCPICHDLQSLSNSLPCGHSFCYTCILPWLTSHKTCPTCRLPISKAPTPNICLDAVIEAFRSSSSSQSHNHTQAREYWKSSEKWDKIFPDGPEANYDAEDR